MGWIRSLEALARGVLPYTAEYELGSECSLHGLLDYGDGRIICAPMSLGRSKDGLWLYSLLISFPQGPVDAMEQIRKADAKGYYFKDGILGELLALLSLFFRCRFYLISSRLTHENPRSGMNGKTEYPFIRINCDPGIHPPVFQSEGKNLAVGFNEFLDRVKTLDRKLHQNFVLACYHYRRAVNEIGVDAEMVFIRLVSAIEALSKDTKLARRDDVLEAQGVADLITQSNLSAELRSELRSAFDVRKSRLKFVRFIEEYCAGYFKGGNFKAAQLKIKKADLGKVLDRIYRARSQYLHTGEPMFLSRPMRGGENWDTDPSQDMIADNRAISGKLKLPYAYFFEGLVRQCLLNYLKKHSAATL